jgi:hypothetical protein
LVSCAGSGCWFAGASGCVSGGGGWGAGGAAWGTPMSVIFFSSGVPAGASGGGGVTGGTCARARAGNSADAPISASTIDSRTRPATTAGPGRRISWAPFTG